VWSFQELKAQFDDGLMGTVVGDRSIARGSHGNQVAYPQKGEEKIGEREAEE
jgi:hypothetical protein